MEAIMILIKEKLARLLFEQEIGNNIKFEDLLEHQSHDYLTRAEKIIQFFIETINNKEFHVC